jgi:hypothetical protein
LAKRKDKAGKQQQHLTIEQTFSDENSARGGRGGRGAGAGGVRRGSGRGGRASRGSFNTPNVEDPAAFPILAK